MDIISVNAALIVIDVQEVLDDPDQGELNNPKAEDIHQVTLGSLQRDGISIIESAELTSPADFSHKDTQKKKRNRGPLMKCFFRRG